MNIYIFRTLKNIYCRTIISNVLAEQMFYERILVIIVLWSRHTFIKQIDFFGMYRGNASLT